MAQNSKRNRVRSSEYIEFRVKNMHIIFSICRHVIMNSFDVKWDASIVKTIDKNVTKSLIFFNLITNTILMFFHLVAHLFQLLKFEFIFCENCEDDKIDVGDGFWRRNMMVTSLRHWSPIWKKSPTYRCHQYHCHVLGHPSIENYLFIFIGFMPELFIVFFIPRYIFFTLL